MGLLAECDLNACKNEIRKPARSGIRIPVLKAEDVCIAERLRCSCSSAAECRSAAWIVNYWQLDEVHSTVQLPFVTSRLLENTFTAGQPCMAIPACAATKASSQPKYRMLPKTLRTTAELVLCPKQYLAPSAVLNPKICRVRHHTAMTQVLVLRTLPLLPLMMRLPPDV